MIIPSRVLIPHIKVATNRKQMERIETVFDFSCGFRDDGGTKFWFVWKFGFCKLINVVVPETIDERAINTKGAWDRNENHTLGLKSAKAIGYAVVNIGTQDLVEGREDLVQLEMVKDVVSLISLKLGEMF